VFRSGYVNTEKVHYCFYKYFSKIRANLKCHNRVFILSSKHPHRPVSARVVSRLFYKLTYKPSSCVFKDIISAIASKLLPAHIEPSLTNCHTRFPCVFKDDISVITSKLLAVHIELSLTNCHTCFSCVFKDIISAIVSRCAHFFSVMLPSSSLLILDFIQATNGVIVSQNMEVRISLTLW